MGDPRHFQFYAIVEDDDGDRRLKRIRMEQGVKEGVSAMFESQAPALLGEDVERLDYDPGYSPDDHEVFALANFELPRHLVEATGAPDAPDGIGERDIEDGLIKALVAVEFPWDDSTSRILFQSFDARQTITKSRRYLVLSTENFTRLEKPGIAIGSKLTAAFVGGTLLFQSQHLTRRFLEVDEAFEIATDDEIRSLLKHPTFATEDLDIVLATADHWTRRKITSIQRRRTLDRVEVSEIIEVARDFEVEVEVITKNGNDQIGVPSDKKQLKRLVRLLDEDLYVSPLTGDRFQANSKRKLPVPA